MTRRGRKAKLNVRREPNGKPSRRVEEVAKRNYNNLERDEVHTLSVGIAARERLFGLQAVQSRDQLAGSFLGRLCLAGQVTRGQYDAAVTWLEERDACSHAMAAPRSPAAVDLNRVQGRPVAAERDDADRAAVAAFRESRRVVREVQNSLGLHAHLLGAMQYVVEQDLELHHLVGDCRIALNALEKHYTSVARRKGVRAA